MGDPSPWDVEAGPAEQAELAGLAGVVGEHARPIDDPRAQRLPVVEHRLAVEQRVLLLAQEGGHGQPVQDHRGRQGRVRRIECVALDLDGRPRKPAPVQRAEQRFEPLGVFVEHGEVGQGVNSRRSKGGCRHPLDQIVHKAALGIPDRVQPD